MVIDFFGAGEADHPAANLGQDLVSFGVAIGIIDVLEMVDVEKTSIEGAVIRFRVVIKSVEIEEARQIVL